MPDRSDLKLCTVVVLETVLKPSWVQKVEVQGHRSDSLHIVGLSPNPCWRAFTVANIYSRWWCSRQHLFASPWSAQFEFVFIICCFCCWWIYCHFEGADITDYFNYGFNEDTWTKYCEKQRRLRIENNANKSGGNLIFVSWSSMTHLLYVCTRGVWVYPYPRVYLTRPIPVGMGTTSTGMGIPGFTRKEHDFSRFSSKNLFISACIFCQTRYVLCSCFKSM